MQVVPTQAGTPEDKMNLFKSSGIPVEAFKALLENYREDFFHSADREMMLFRLKHQQQQGATHSGVLQEFLDLNKGEGGSQSED